ncbi:MAG: hypothetical protein AAGN82_04150 [Myxococcota bacterium]
MKPLYALRTTRFGGGDDGRRAEIARVPEGEVRRWIRRVAKAPSVAYVFG